MRTHYTTLRKLALATVAVAGSIWATRGARAAVVINEVYAGGGNNGATLNADFFELYNNGLTAAPIGGFTMQYGSAAGNFASNTFTSVVIPDGVSIAPGDYYLIEGSPSTSSGSGTFTTFSYDLASTLNGATAGGKIRLIDTTGATVDLVGWGTATAATATTAGFTGPGFETAAAPAGSNTLSMFRKVTGVDTNDNSLDFTTGTPTPQASGSGAPVPEPASVGLAVAAGALLIGRRRNR